MATGDVPTARCVYCRVDVAVPSTYAHGDHIKCGACGTKHKVVRGDRLRLVLADTAPLKESLAQNEQLVHRLEAELAHARASYGVGANGIGIGVVYMLYQLGFKGAALNAELVGNAAVIALVTGLLFEVANFLFLAKRHQMTRITAELEEAEEEGARLRQLIREATRV
jgi:hypothetical protein